jgi:peptide/nickel transport system permease protein
MKLARGLLWRLGAGLVVLWGTATLVFLVINLTPGDPAITILGGPDALPTPAMLHHVRAEYGFDQPLWLQYLHYLARLLHGNFGVSYRLHQPVLTLIAGQFGATATLAFWAMALGSGLALVVALTTAKRARWLTALLTGAEVTLSSIPPFITGLLLLLAFSFSLHLFPSSSTHGWTSIILPTITLALPIAGVLTQVLRRELEDILEQPFIVTARMRGLSEAGVRFGHALRHALIPTLTILGVMFTTLLSSAVVVETVFNRQGLGRMMSDATTNRDVPLVLGIALLAASINILANIVVDFIYVFVDPRTERHE